MAVGTVVAEVGRLPSSHGSVMRGFRDVPRSDSPRLERRAVDTLPTLEANRR